MNRETTLVDPANHQACNKYHDAPAILLPSSNQSLFREASERW
jgi:hypothetical protein